MIDAAADLVVGLDHLGQCTRLSDQQIVGQQHGEWLVADKMARAPHGMAETQRLLLPRERHRAADRQAFQQAVELFGLLAGLQERLELIGMVEMVFDDVLAATGDEDELLDAGFFGLFDGILDDRFVDHGQHLFGNRLRCRQKAGSHAGDGKYCFANGLGNLAMCHRI